MALKTKASDIGRALSRDELRKLAETAATDTDWEAAARLLLRASLLKPKATEPDHYLLPKNNSRIAHSKEKGSRGYDPAKHQLYWDSAWHSLTEAAGLKGFRFHDLRHTFITHMAERGVPLGPYRRLWGTSAPGCYGITPTSAVAPRAERLNCWMQEPILTHTQQKQAQEQVYHA